MLNEKLKMLYFQHLDILCILIHHTYILYISIYLYKTYTNVHSIVIITFHNI